jgi:phosphatidylglycerophosphate synthase
MAMDLHRAVCTAEWQDVPHDKRNSWQRIASKTNAVITPGNVITVLGFIIVIYGLYAITQHHYWAGVVCLTIGRLMDIADGLVAQSTGTKSRLGESLDAGFDKLATVLTLAALIVAHVASLRLLIVLAVPHVIITAISYTYMRRKIRLHPSLQGKLSMASAWVCLVGLVVIQAAHAPSHSIITIFVYILAVISVAFGLYAASDYISQKK